MAKENGDFGQLAIANLRRLTKEGVMFDEAWLWAKESGALRVPPGPPHLEDADFAAEIANKGIARLCVILQRGAPGAAGKGAEALGIGGAGHGHILVVAAGDEPAFGVVVDHCSDAGRVRCSGKGKKGWRGRTLIEIRFIFLGVTKLSRHTHVGLDHRETVKVGGDGVLLTKRNEREIE